MVEETIEKAKKAEKVEKLVGMEVRLNPAKSGMYLDPANGIALNFLKNEDGEVANDRIEITSKMDIKKIKGSIKAGTLRVYKKGNDVSEKFGGPALADRNRPIVKQPAPRPDAGDSLDNSLIKVLQTHDLNKIAQYINTVGKYFVLDRLMQLEKMGENKCSQPRSAIIEAIAERQKHVSGMTVEVDTEQEEVVLK